MNTVEPCEASCDAVTPVVDDVCEVDEVNVVDVDVDKVDEVLALQDDINIISITIPIDNKMDEINRRFNFFIFITYLMFFTLKQ